MIASGSASRTALRTAPGSSRSSTTGSAPSARTRSPCPGDRNVPSTSWPRSISRGTSRLPIAPLAPATKTRIMSFLSVSVGVRDSRRTPSERRRPTASRELSCRVARAGASNPLPVTRLTLRLRLRQAAADGVASQVHPVAHPELVKDVRSVAFDGLVADHQQRRDLPAGVAFGDQLDDLGLARRQRVVRELFAVRRTLQVVPDERLHRARVDEGLAAHRRATSLDEIPIRDGLEHVPGCPGPQRLEEVALVVMHGEHQGAYLRLGLGDAAGRLDAREAGHCDVEDGQVDVVGECQLDCLRAVVSLGDDLEVWLGLQHHPQATPHDGVVVGEQDPGLEWRGHEGTSAGSLRLTSVPGSSSRIEILPPTSSARSRMPCRPPPRLARWSSPTPLSATRRVRNPSARLSSTTTSAASACLSTFVSASCATR